MTQTPPPTAIETVSELKPCPLCGAAPRIDPAKASGTAEWFIITCYPGCGLRLEGQHVYAGAKDSTKVAREKAVAAWNRRSLDTADGVESVDHHAYRVAHIACRDFIADPCGSSKCAGCGKRRSEHLASRTPNTETVVKAESLLAIRDALLADDLNEAYHQLYMIADPAFCEMEPWRNLEHKAALASPPSPAEVTLPDGSLRQIVPSHLRREAEDLAQEIWSDLDDVRTQTKLTDAWAVIGEACGDDIIRFAARILPALAALQLNKKG